MSRRPAQCAACGVAIRKQERIRFDGSHVIHSTCAAIPTHLWSHRASEEENDTLRLRLRGLESEVRHLKTENAHTQGQSYLTVMAKVEHLEAECLRLQRQRDAAEASADGYARQVTTLSGRIAAAEAARDRAIRAANTVGSVHGPTYDLVKQAVGLATGRGIWGMARYYSTLLLDRIDDAEARYRLLELS